MYSLKTELVSFIPFIIPFNYHSKVIQLTITMLGYQVVTFYSIGKFHDLLLVAVHVNSLLQCELYSVQ